jgi:hypothetical protein
MFFFAFFAEISKCKQDAYTTYSRLPLFLLFERYVTDSAMFSLEERF